jgi:ABC-type Zn2+ transport system substrate-binding protein/surface adhesin
VAVMLGVALRDVYQAAQAAYAASGAQPLRRRNRKDDARRQADQDAHGQNMDPAPRHADAHDHGHEHHHDHDHGPDPAHGPAAAEGSAPETP